MVMAPLDLRNREFRKAFRGYVEEEVDGFLELVITDYEDLYRENLSLREQLAQKEDNISHYRHLEETLKSTLVVAQKTAEDVRSAAEKESMALLANARREVELLLKEAEAKAETVIKDAQERAKAIVQEYGEIQKQAHMFKVSLRSLLQAQIELLNQNFLTVETVSEQGTALEQWIAKEQGNIPELAGEKAALQELAVEQAAAGQEEGTDQTKVFLREPRYIPNVQGD
ncbi:MAG: DivIVA domain-containing protein [Firmicutes bacterium]|nr:DivIVA domain-containing protein [Bacillota bacterium]